MVEAGDDDDGLLSGQHLKDSIKTLLHAAPGTVAVSAATADKTSRGERQSGIGGDNAAANLQSLATWQALPRADPSSSGRRPNKGDVAGMLSGCTAVAAWVNLRNQPPLTLNLLGCYR